MIYNNEDKNFKQHVHPRLQKRIRIFFILGGAMLAAVAWDIVHHTVSFPIALIAILVGAIIGWFTSRIFHLSWDKDGEQVVGRIDKIGWFVLVAYIVFEIARATLFETVIHAGIAATAITFAFVSSALISRVFGLRGRIVRILKEEKILG